MENDAVATGTTVLQLLQAGRFAEVHELVVPALREPVSADALRGSWEGLIAAQGAVTLVGTPFSESAGTEDTIVKIPVTCERGAFALVMAIDQAGRLAGLRFAPPEPAEPVKSRLAVGNWRHRAH
jgi:hypothetical protein